MSLSGLKSLLGNAAELLKSNTTESTQQAGLPEISRKNQNGDLLAANLSYDNNAMDAVTNRFIEARNTNSLIASNSPGLSSAETNSTQTPTPKAIIIPLRAGSKSATHDELSRSVVRATLEQNGIKPSNLEMEEIMALPQNQDIDMNVQFGKNWKVYDLPGLMPSPGKFTDASGRQVFGYGMTLSPDWQAQTIEAYKQVRGELAKPENVNRKAVVDMKMTERLNETVKIAWEKGYISEEVKNQLGNITPEELAAAFTIGGVIGIIGTTEAGAAALGPIGGAIGLAYTVNQMAKFDHIADGAARATNRQQLDKPAQEFGAFLGSLSKDGVLALVGMAGGAIAPRTMPQVEAALTNKVGNVKRILKEGMPQLKEPRLAPANGAPIETPNIKTANGKTAVEKMQEPLQSASVDSNGNPSGIRLQNDYKAHVSQRDFSVPQKRGIGGAHNLNEFNKYKSQINIVRTTPHPTVKGVYKIEYQMPALDKTGKPTGLWRNEIYPKTVYDPAVISNEQMMGLGRQAFADAVSAGRVKAGVTREWEGVAPNGIKFHGYVDVKTGAARSFFPEF